MENYGTMKKSYGTMDKTMVLYLELWYYIDNYGTWKKNMTDYQKLRNFEL